MGLIMINEIQVASAEAYLKSLPSEKVDMHITSCPYDDMRRYKQDKLLWDFHTIAQEAYRTLKPGGVLVWVVGDQTKNGSETLSSFRQALYFVDVVGFNMHDTMIYQKDSSGYPQHVRYNQLFEYMFVLSKGKPKTINLLREPCIWAGHITRNSSQRNHRDELVKIEDRVISDTKVMGNVWKFSVGNRKSTPDAIAYQHPAIFPEKLAEMHIQSWSEPGDIICDFFMGSGTTAKAAVKLGRKYMGCDISPEYVEIARQRVSMYVETQKTMV